jgi:hypothetical protein
MKFLRLLEAAGMSQPAPLPSALETLGFTATAGMLFLAGAIGALMRAASSPTQMTWSQRTFVDMVVGGIVGVMLPRFAPALDTALGIKFDTWTSVQQAALALVLGGSGSYFWTVIGWRKGLIVTPEQASTGVKPPPPEPGVLKGTKDAETAATKFEDDADTTAREKPWKP